MSVTVKELNEQKKKLLQQERIKRKMDLLLSVLIQYVPYDVP